MDRPTDEAERPTTSLGALQHDNEMNQMLPPMANYGMHFSVPPRFEFNFNHLSLLHPDTVTRSYPPIAPPDYHYSPARRNAVSCVRGGRYKNRGHRPIYRGRTALPYRYRPVRSVYSSGIIDQLANVQVSAEANGGIGNSVVACSQQLVATNAEHHRLVRDCRRAPPENTDRSDAAIISLTRRLCLESPTTSGEESVQLKDPQLDLCTKIQQIQLTPKKKTSLTVKPLYFMQDPKFNRPWSNQLQ